MIRPARAVACLTAALLLVAPAAESDEIEGVEFPDLYLGQDTPMKLNGVGLLRHRVVFKGYVAALYLGEGIPSERALDDVPRRLEIEYFWSIDAEDFGNATSVGIAKNVDETKLEELRDEIEHINRLYEDVEPGDRYSLTYVPGEGTELALNGRSKGVVEGADFSSALFAIWLGDGALDEGLRDDLLSGR